MHAVCRPTFICKPLKNLNMQKKFSFFICAICLWQLTQAQFNVGDKLLGGELQLGFNATNFQSGSSSNDSKNGFGSIQLNFAKANRENAVRGFRFAFNYSSSDIGNNSKAESLGFGVGVFKRKYLALGKQFFVFGEAAIDYTYSSTDMKTNNVSTSSAIAHRIAFGFSPGFAYAISKKWLASARFNELLAIGYNHQKNETATTPIQTSTNQQLFLNSSSSIGNFFFGVNYVF